MTKQSAIMPIARAALILLASISFSALAQDNEASWKALTKEPSRAQLFRGYAGVPATPARGRNLSPALRSFSFVFPYAFHFPTDALHDRNGAARTNALFGLDISHYEGKHFPVAVLKAEHVDFIYVKATQGTDFKDPEFGENWAALAALPDEAHIPRGAYHFLASRVSQTGKEQADRFLAYVALHGGFKPGDLPPAVDLEWDRLCKDCADRWTSNNRSAADIIATAREFLDRIREKTGRTPLLYTNKSFLADHQISSEAQIGELTHGVKVWIFDLSESDLNLELPDPEKNLAHSLWQFSWGSKLPVEYTKDLDVDYFKGSAQEFATAFLGNE